jgi:hypothetical protein
MSYESYTDENAERDPDREEEYAAETSRVWITDDNHEPVDQDDAEAFNDESVRQEYANLTREDPEGSEVYEDATEFFAEPIGNRNDTLHDNQEVDSETKAHVKYITHYSSRAEAVTYLKKNMLRVTEIWPTRLERPDPVWNKNWLDRAILVFKDPRTHVRRKLIANCFCDVENIGDVLMAAWKFGLPFHLFLPESDTRLFGDWTMSRMDELALPKLYGSGFTKRFLTKVNGPQAQYAAWIASASEVFRRPNAVAFIAEGGIVSEIAQVIDPTLIHRFAKGPSVQVAEFSKGEKFLQRDPPEGERHQFFYSRLCLRSGDLDYPWIHTRGKFG